ncbi:cupin [Brachybacterium vulturis]|uniref:Cupin n=1 Tax=Brachybacterium vulturis TaxID=2017484 RepID=A0A291GM17_9MICO|nr:cupin domain-containing protein [Brachybacterium vulturis]ATG51217.1 cupin [Brachybacterium vulturis]
MDPVDRRGRYAVEFAMHEGRGPLSVEHHFAGDSQLMAAVQTWTLGPGACEGMHAHDDPPLEELYLVMEGRARIRQDGESFELGPGDSLRSPAGTPHDLANPGEGPLRVVVIWGPPGTFDQSGFGSFRRALEARRAADA